MAGLDSVCCDISTGAVQLYTHLILAVSAAGMQQRQAVLEQAPPGTLLT